MIAKKHSINNGEDEIEQFSLLRTYAGVKAHIIKIKRPSAVSI